MLVTKEWGVQITTKQQLWLFNPYPVVGYSGITRLTQQFSKNYFDGITSDTVCLDLSKRVYTTLVLSEYRKLE